MAGYVYLKGNPRPHRFIVKRKGHRTLTKTFIVKDDGERWAREEERSIDLTGMPLGMDKLDIPVTEIVDRYLREVTPTKANEGETYALKRFLEFAKSKGKSLAAFAKQDAYAYRDKRLKDTWSGPKGNWKTAKPITPRTVKREVVVLHHVYEIAREQWGYSNLTNPFEGVEIKGTKHRRKRRLLPGEEERLDQACEKCLGLNRTYVPLAMALAIETGMRLDEIFNLTWEDLDFDKRTIEVIKSKTDHVSDYAGRTIVMTLGASLYFLTLKFELRKKTDTWATGLIFPMTKDAFEQAFDEVLVRAEIKPDRRGEKLQFRDLRREAGSRFDEAGLTKSENELMLGHQGQDTNSIYIASKLKSIRDKLDKHMLGGKTFEEVLAEPHDQLGTVAIRELVEAWTKLDEAKEKGA